MSKKDKILYISMNMGCSGKCELCPTKNMIGCDKITVEKLINWANLEKTITNTKAKYICLIGGENPFKYSNGHNNIYYHIYNKVKSVGKHLIAVCGYEGTTNTNILPYFEQLHLFVPKCWEEEKLKVLNTLYIKSYTDIRTYIETETVNEKWLSKVRLAFFVKPTILLESEEERRKIKEYRSQHGDFDFVGSIINKKCQIYSMADDKLYNNAKQKRIPWRKLLGLEN